MDVAIFSRLLGPQGQELLHALADFRAEDELQWATRLRREYPAELVAAALGQARLRQRAKTKFGADAERMYFTPNGVEQSTRIEVAAHRAARIAAAGVRRVADLCCGIGGDALALARAGVQVLAVDLDLLTCAVVRANAEALGVGGLVDVRQGDVTDLAELPDVDAAFLDPARRGARGRVFDPEAYSPPLSFLSKLSARVPRGAAKVAPGIPHEVVPDGMTAEWVSYNGDVKEAVLWWGEFAEGGGVRATLLPAGDTLATTSVRPAPSRGAAGRYLYEPDGAVIRAHLVAEVAEAVGGALIDPSIAYITTDELTPSPFATAYEITDVMPFNLKKLKALVRERGIGHLTVKKRGSAVEPEEVRRRVKPSGKAAATVFLTRVAGAPSMLVGQPAGDRA